MRKEFKHCARPFFIEVNNGESRIEFFTGGATRQEVEDAFRLISEWEEDLKESGNKNV